SSEVSDGSLHNHPLGSGAPANLAGSRALSAVLRDVDTELLEGAARQITGADVARIDDVEVAPAVERNSSTVANLRVAGAQTQGPEEPAGVVVEPDASTRDDQAPRGICRQRADAWQPMRRIVGADHADQTSS